MKALLLALFLGAPLAAADVASGTLALYFDDTRCSGETADASSNGYTLTENGSVNYNSSPTPPVGTKNVGVFSAANYYDAPAGLRTAWSSLTNFTWQAYIYLNALPGGGSFFYLMSLNSGSGVGGCYVDSAGAFHCHIGATYIDGSASGIATGQWVHVAFTRSSSDGKMRIYINNASAATAVTVGTNGAVSDLELGRYYTGILPTNGYFNQVRFSNVAETSFPTTDPALTTTPAQQSDYLRNITRPRLRPSWSLLPRIFMAPRPASALPDNSLNTQAWNAATIQAANTILSYTPTPTLTPTQVACGNTVRIAQYGDSIQRGNGCLPESDSFRAVMIGQLNAAGKDAKMVGSYTVPDPSSYLACAKTDAVSGSTMAQIYTRIHESIGTNLPTPASTDVVILGGGTAAVILGDNEAGVLAGYKACITRTAAASALINIVLVRPPDAVAYDISAAQSAATQAFTWAQAGGYNVHFFDAESLLTSSHLCPDELHITAAGYSILGTAMATTITAFLP